MIQILIRVLGQSMTKTLIWVLNLIMLNNFGFNERDILKKNVIYKTFIHIQIETFTN
jgi:hypothetical protein